MDAPTTAHLALLLIAITVALGALLVWMFWSLQTRSDDGGRHDGGLKRLPVRLRRR
jgi:hypothetical protein